jgi:hypothetical protein
VSLALLKKWDPPAIEHCPSEPVGPAAVDLDGYHGALVLLFTPRQAGMEVEIAPVTDLSRRQHVWVMPRQASTAVVHAALFACLEPGDYRVIGRDGSPGSQLTVRPGRVTTTRQV